MRGFNKSAVAIVSCLLAGSWGSALHGQSWSDLAPEVREHVRVRGPIVALVHVQVIDGTGGRRGPVRRS